MSPTNPVARAEREALLNIAVDLRAGYEMKVKFRDGEPSVEDQILLAKASAIAEFINAVNARSSGK